MRTNNTRPLFATLLLLLLTLPACRPDPATSHGRILYSGPTDPMSVVLAKVRRNNEAVTTLWSRHDFEATVYDDRGKGRYVSGSGILMYREPRDLRIDFDVTAAGRVFQIGSNDDRFWASIAGDVDTLYWANWRNADRPCIKSMPVRPDLVVEVLGIADVPDNLLADPTPVMRYNNAEDVYMIVWSARGPDQMYPVKEIWYDRQTLRPKMVNVFNPLGRIVLRAYLSNFKPLTAAPGTAAAAGGFQPTVPTRYDLLFPDTRNKMVLDLREPQLSYRGAPNDRTFRFPETPDVSKVDQIDADCRP